MSKVLVVVGDLLIKRLDDPPEVIEVDIDLPCDECEHNISIGVACFGYGHVEDCPQSQKSLK